MTTHSLNNLTTKSSKKDPGLKLMVTVKAIHAVGYSKIENNTDIKYSRYVTKYYRREVEAYLTNQN